MMLLPRPVFVFTLLALPILGSASVKEPLLPVDDVRLFAEIFGGIKNYYVDEVTDKKLIENAIKGMVSGLDPHSSFLDGKAYKDLQEATAGEFGGLGIEITKDVQGVRVVSPIDDTPAARAAINNYSLLSTSSFCAAASLRSSMTAIISAIFASLRTHFFL